MYIRFHSDNFYFGRPITGYFSIDIGRNIESHELLNGGYVTIACLDRDRICVDSVGNSYFLQELNFNQYHLIEVS
jgi:hypothetical protein